MSEGRYEHKGRRRRRTFGNKSLSLVLACVLLVGGVIGGTVAWLTAQTSEVENTFSTSDIGVQLTETTTKYKMVPGWDITKDPKAWITEGSEDAYLFVKVEKSANFDNFMTYKIADGWIELESAAGTNYKVYYREVTSSQMGEGNASAILKDNKVTVKDTVTKEMMSPEDVAKPTLTFTAYASQLMKNNTTEFTAEQAWNNVKPAIP